MRESTVRRPTRGAELERLVLAECGRHNAPVVLEHVAQAARRTPRGLIAVPGPCDFIGTVRGSGRAIVFDCKECSGAASFGASRDHLPPHQVDQLVRHGQAGAVAGLLILSTMWNDVYWLDWTQLVRRRPTYRWNDLPVVGKRRKGIEWGMLLLWSRAALPASADRGRG